VDECSSSRGSERASNSAKLAQLVEAVTTEEVDVRSKSELLVQDDTKVANNSGKGKMRESDSKSNQLHILYAYMHQCINLCTHASFVFLFIRIFL
jgi:hypothetical protein